jgi:mRNA interferase MazF
VICSPGDTVLVPYPFVEKPISKTRPAVALTSNWLNENHGQTILAMITTGAGSRRPSDVPIVDAAQAGLSHASVIRFKTFTLPNALLYRSLGKLCSQDHEALQDRLRSCLQLV